LVENSIEKKKKKRKINWSEYNESLVRRGEMLFDDGFLQNWRAELKKMNKGKEGANYRYPNSSILLLLATVHVYLLPYRQLEGFLRMMSVHIKRPRDSTRLHNHLVESNKVKDKPRSKSKPRKRRYSDSS
jgi:Transposase DDE domain